MVLVLFAKTDRVTLWRIALSCRDGVGGYPRLTGGDRRARRVYGKGAGSVGGAGRQEVPALSKEQRGFDLRLPVGAGRRELLLDKKAGLGAARHPKNQRLLPADCRRATASA